MTRSRQRLRAAVAILGMAIVLTEAGCADDAAALPVPTAARPCPPWVDFPVDHFSNADSPYLGCSNAANLRAMVADPADLEHGRQLGPSDGERETRAVQAYEQGKVKAFQGTGSLSPEITMPGAGSAGTP